MIIFLNNEPLDVPGDSITVADLMEFKNIKPQATAIAINNKIIRKDAWNVTAIPENSHVTVITAAFGG